MTVNMCIAPSACTHRLVRPVSPLHSAGSVPEIQLSLKLLQAAYPVKHNTLRGAACSMQPPAPSWQPLHMIAMLQYTLWHRGPSTGSLASLQHADMSLCSAAAAWRLQADGHPAAAPRTYRLCNVDSVLHSAGSVPSKLMLLSDLQSRKPR